MARAAADVFVNLAPQPHREDEHRLGPWAVVEANDKFYARVKVVQTLTKALEAVK